jgi:hypothetical protein
MANNPLQDQARSNIMLAANLITKINLGPLFTGLRPILTMQSGFSDFIPETTEVFNILKKDITSIYNDYFNRAAKKIPLTNIAYELSNANDGGVIKLLSDLVTSMTDLQQSAEISKSKNFNILNSEIDSLVAKLTQARDASSKAFQALNKLQIQQPAAPSKAAGDYQVNKIIRLASLIQKKYRI